LKNEDSSGLTPTPLSQQNLLRGNDVSFFYHVTLVNNCPRHFLLKKTKKFKITKKLFFY